MHYGIYMRHRSVRASCMYVLLATVVGSVSFHVSILMPRSHTFENHAIQHVPSCKCLGWVCERQRYFSPSNVHKFTRTSVKWCACVDCTGQLDFVSKYKSTGAGASVLDETLLAMDTAEYFSSASLMATVCRFLEYLATTSFTAARVLRSCDKQQLSTSIEKCAIWASNHPEFDR